MNAEDEGRSRRGSPLTFCVAARRLARGDGGPTTNSNRGGRQAGSQEGKGCRMVSAEPQVMSRPHQARRPQGRASARLCCGAPLKWPLLASKLPGCLIPAILYVDALYDRSPPAQHRSSRAPYFSRFVYRFCRPLVYFPSRFFSLPFWMHLPFSSRLVILP